MDIFIEQLYQQRSTIGTNLKKTAIIVLGSLIALVLLFVAVFIMPSLATIFLLLASGSAYLTYHLCGMYNVEYEYILTEGIIDIDRITNQKKRKRMITFKAADINGLGSVDRMPCGRDVKWFCNKGEGLYFSVGDNLIAFCPNEKFRNEMSKFLPRHLKKELK